MSAPSRAQLLEIALRLVKRDENQGLCVECGAIAECVEPDATKYQCEECEAWAVYGAEQYLLIFS